MKQKRFEYEGLVFWPVDGNIHMIDTHTSEFKIITLSQLCDRYNHLKYVFVNNGYDNNPSERLKMAKCLENLEECIKIAASQLESKNLQEYIPKTARKLK